MLDKDFIQHRARIPCGLCRRDEGLSSFLPQGLIPCGQGAGFIKKMKQRLLEEKKGVEQKIADLTKPEKPIDNPDEGDIAQDAAEDIIEELSFEAFKDMLEKIDAALERIKKGTYGKCLKTGKDIPQERLKEEPWAEERAPADQ